MLSTGNSIYTFYFLWKPNWRPWIPFYSSDYISFRIIFSLQCEHLFAVTYNLFILVIHHSGNVVTFSLSHHHHKLLQLWVFLKSLPVAAFAETQKSQMWEPFLMKATIKFTVILLNVWFFFRVVKTLKNVFSNIGWRSVLERTTFLEFLDLLLLATITRC